MTFEESDWGNRDWDWEGEIECARCAPLYAFVGAGRGVDVVRAEDKARRERLRGDAEVLERSVLESSEVGIVLDQVAAAFDALPSVAARYRLAVQLGIETATLPTFRKHVRSVSMRRWLDWQFPRAPAHLRKLIPLFEYVGADAQRVRESHAHASVLREQAGAVIPAVLSLGPISPMAALAGGVK